MGGRSAAETSGKSQKRFMHPGGVPEISDERVTRISNRVNLQLRTLNIQRMHELEVQGPKLSVES